MAHGGEAHGNVVAHWKGRQLVIQVYDYSGQYDSYEDCASQCRPALAAHRNVVVDKNTAVQEIGTKILHLVIIIMTALIMIIVSNTVIMKICM